MKKIRILYLVDKLIRGGGESLLLDIVKYLNKDNFKDPVIVCLGKYNETVVNELEKLEAKVIIMNLNLRKIDKILFRPLFKIIRLFNDKMNFDIIHSYSLYTNVLARFLKVKFKVPVVGHHHGPAYSLPKLPVIANKITFPLGDSIVSVSKGVEESFYKEKNLMSKLLISDNKLNIIYNTLDLNKIDKMSSKKRDINNIIEELEIDKSSPVIGTVGRLVPTKGHEYLISSMKTIVSKIPDVKLIIIGDGSLREDLNTQIKKMKLTEHVFLVGRYPREKVFKTLKLMDVFAFPSLYEGFGIAVAEAMATETPVVATNICGVNEVVKDEHTGILVPPKNEDELAKVLIKLLTNKTIAKQLAKNARKKIENSFSVENIIPKYEKLYMDLIAR